jgi:hypothetical protein
MDNFYKSFKTTLWSHVPTKLPLRPSTKKVRQVIPIIIQARGPRGIPTLIGDGDLFHSKVLTNGILG